MNSNESTNVKTVLDDQTNNNKDDVENPKVKAKSRQLTTFQKILYTSLMFYTGICSAFGETGISPSIVDLTYILNATVDQISIFYTMSSIGFIAGSLFGFLYKYLNRQITITILVFLSGACLFSVPHAPSVTIYYLFAFVTGLSNGTFENAATVWLIEIWKEKCNPFLQLTQSAFGVGLIITPLISKPFVFGNQDEETNQGYNISTTEVPSIFHQEYSDSNNIVSVEERKSSLTWPFLIMGSVQLMAGVLHLTFLLCKKYEYVPDNQELVSEKSKETSNVTSQDLIENSGLKKSPVKLFDNPGSPYKLIVCLAALCIATYNSSVMGHFQFGPTFSQYIPLELSASDAALIHSYFSITFTIGRGLCVFISLKLKPQTMLSTNFVLLLAANLALMFSGDSRILLILGNVLIGLGCASFWPSFFAFVQQYMTYTDKLGAFIVFNAGLVKCFTPIFVGRVIENNPLYLIYIDLASLIICAVSFILILINVAIYSRSHKNKNGE